MIDYALKYVERAVDEIPYTGDASVIARTGPIAWTHAIVEFFSKYARPPGMKWETDKE